VREQIEAIRSHVKKKCKRTGRSKSSENLHDVPNAILDREDDNACKRLLCLQASFRVASSRL
jgi:hypothetical protein